MAGWKNGNAPDSCCRLRRTYVASLHDCAAGYWALLLSRVFGLLLAGYSTRARQVVTGGLQSGRRRVGAHGSHVLGLSSGPPQRRHSESTAARSPRVHNGSLDGYLTGHRQGERGSNSRAATELCTGPVVLSKYVRNKGSFNVKDRVHIHSWLQLRSSTNGPRARPLHRYDARPWDLHETTLTSTVKKRSRASCVPGLRLEPDPELPSHRCSLGNNVSHATALNLIQTHARPRSQTCHQRADRETWACLVDRDRFLSL